MSTNNKQTTTGKSPSSVAIHLLKGECKFELKSYVNPEDPSEGKSISVCSICGREKEEDMSLVERILYQDFLQENG